jgi:hypothetical protein
VTLALIITEIAFKIQLSKDMDLGRGDKISWAYIQELGVWADNESNNKLLTW